MVEHLPQVIRPYTQSPVLSGKKKKKEKELFLPRSSQGVAVMTHWGFDLNLCSDVGIESLLTSESSVYVLRVETAIFQKLHVGSDQSKELSRTGQC